MNAPLSIRPDGFEPGWLWSLWDMLVFHANIFMALQQGLGAIKNSFVAGDSLNDETVSSLKHILIGIKINLENINLYVSLMACNDLISLLQDEDDVSRSTMFHKITELEARIKDELGGKRFLSLNNKEATLFDNKEPHFGTNIQNKFQSASYEIDESAKCLSLSRTTASVFHLMRVMEIGIFATARCLGVPDPIKAADRNWGAILRVIKNNLDDRNKPGEIRWNDISDKSFFEDTYVSLDAVRNAWRNSTMHVENKYTGEEAEHVFIAVKGFMKKLALRMDENGKPLA